MSRRSSRLTNAGYYNLRGQSVVSYKETATYKRSRRSSPDSRRKTTSKNIVRLAPEDSVAGGLPGCNSNIRTSWASRISIIRWLFYMLPLCLGIVCFTLVLSTYQGLGKQVRVLQDEVLRLKRINELPPGDTMPNFALESLGACVLPKLSSKTRQSTEPTFSFSIWNFLIPFWRPQADPSIITQGGPTVAGRCWPFHGERGHLVLALSHPVTISHVTLGHISKTLSPTGNISTAPKMFAVYGMKTKEDEGTLLGTFLYNQDGEKVQTFKLPDQEQGVFSHVKLQVESNWGHPDYTCVYSFRVHGTVSEQTPSSG